MTKAEVQEIIDEADENGDGKLDYKEVSDILSERSVVETKRRIVNQMGWSYVIWEELRGFGM